MKVSERARQSSIIDLYIHMYIYAYMSENDLLTDRHSLVNFKNKSGELWRILTISFILSIIYSVNRFLWCNIETIVSTCIVLFMYICVRSLSSFKLSLIQYVRVREIKEHREREQPALLLCLCVNLCNRILNWSSLLSFFFSKFFFSFCLYRLIALFYRSIQTVAAPPPSPSHPSLVDLFYSFIHSNMKIYSSLFFVDDDATSRQIRREIYIHF
jgi:hypothetical protein